MKKIITLFIAAFSVVSISSYSQAENEDPQQMMKQRLKDSLQFTDAQIDSVISIKEEFQPKIREVRMDENLDKAAKKSQIVAIKQEIRTRLKSVLTDEQIIQLNSLEEEMRGAKRRLYDSTMNASDSTLQQ